MSGHTPLPWHIRDTSTVGIEIGTEEVKVAKAFVGDGHAGYVEEQANARLIVQACNAHDELLEAATKALDFLEKYHGDLDAPSEELDALYEVLDDAIAKAERA